MKVRPRSGRRNPRVLSELTCVSLLCAQEAEADVAAPVVGIVFASTGRSAEGGKVNPATAPYHTV